MQSKLKTILKKVEDIEAKQQVDSNRRPVKILSFAIEYPDGGCPPVIDRPTGEWELYKKAVAEKEFSVSLSPQKEYTLRTGKDVCPKEERISYLDYCRWQCPDNKLLLKQLEERGGTLRDTNETEQNGTK